MPGRRRGRWAIASGVVSGTVYGLAQGVGDRSVARGVVSGVLFGAYMVAIQCAAVAANRHLADLSLRQQRAVVRAVRLDPVADPALAEATILHAQRVQGLATVPRVGARARVGALDRERPRARSGPRDRRRYGAVAGAFSLVVWILVLAIGPSLDRRRAQRARTVELAARGVNP